MADHVVVLPYDPAWPEAFAAESAEMRSRLEESGLACEHIGSTAVPGLAAKPTIDLMVGAAKAGVAPAVIKALESLGYGYLGEYGIPGREFFRKGLPPTHHIHWVEKGGAFWNDQLLFRDFMRLHPAECAEYERVKRELAQRFSEDRKSYTASKGGLILKLMQRARESVGVRRVVVDLEATCWEAGTAIERQEIIEIGAVELDASLTKTREFGRLVRPAREPLLTPFCLGLTGITQEAVDAAEPFAASLRTFLEWTGAGAFELCSWGDYDLEQFRVECARADVPLPASFERHIDLRALFARRHGLPPGTTAEAMQRLGLEPDGRAHRALDDARNVARLAQVLLKG